MPRYIATRNKVNEIRIKRDRSWDALDKNYTDNRFCLEAKNKNQAFLTARGFFHMIDEEKNKQIGSTVSQSTEVKTS